MGAENMYVSVKREVPNKFQLELGTNPTLPEEHY